MGNSILCSRLGSAVQIFFTIQVAGNLFGINMIGQTKFVKPVLNLVLCGGLLGCATSAQYAPPGRELTQMPPAPLGTAEAGDRYFYANGRKERVTGVENGLIDIRRSSRYQYRRFQDFIFAEKAVTRRSITSNAEVVDQSPEKSLWPLRVGNNIKFGVVKTRAGVPDADPANPKSYWNCYVDGMQTVAVIAGEFDTYRIECTRRNRRNKIKQYITHYYAPAIQQVVLRIDRYSYKPAKRLELVAFKPTLNMLSRGSASRYEQHFQNTLETVASGSTTSWWSRRSDTRIHTTPTVTRKIGENLYCRNFLIKVDNKGLARSGAGLACRDIKGKWRIPREIDIREGGVKF